MERRSQVVNRPSASPAVVVSVSQPTVAEPYLRGRWLFLARVGWIVLTLLILTLNAIMFPRYDAALQSPCQPGALCFSLQLTTYDRQVLHQLGLSLGFLAAYQVMLDAVTVAIYCTLGALIFWHKSADRMALFCAFMLVLVGGVTSTNILQDTLVPVSPAWYVLLGTLALLGQSSFLIFFFLFPSGRFVPRWTRWFALFVLLYCISVTFLTPLFSSQRSGANLLFFAILFCTVGTQVYRYRHISTPRERQQTKWVVYGFAIGIVGFVLLITIGKVFLPKTLLQSSVLSTFVAGTGIYGFLLLIPISLAIAILRSHLYDIDVVINRTLVYGSLTGILGALYTGLIIGLEILAGAITGSAVQQPVVLVISTLAIAVLVQPLRKRIQTIIDQRFYRRKYDAQKTLAAFSATLRNKVNLSELRAQLLAVVQETMQPVHVSLWLRQPERLTKEPTHHLEPPGQEPPKPNGD